MKLTLAFILFFTFQLYANGYGQQKINLKAKKIEVKEVLSSIEKQTNYRFLYNNDLIELNNTVAIHAKNARLEEVLPDLFNGTALTYLMMENDLIVVKENPTIARDVVVRGQVMDDKGAPLAGVSVMVKGTTTGTTTNANGEFSLTAPNANAILVFTSVGYDDLEQPLAGSNTINVVMKASQKVMDQVVVIGYGTAAKRDLTAPVASVNREDLVKRTTANAMDALQGSVSGVQVVSKGSPGSSPTVRIRGVGSLNNEAPLYVVDGMFVDNIDFLNTNDIVDMSILKDASAAAIYGVKAANGVVLITTKKGKMNMKTSVTYNGYIGFQTPTNVLRMANGQQYAAMELAKKSNSDSAHVLLSSSKFGGSGVNPTTNTNWYNELLKKQALMHNQSVDISGGTEKVNYTLGVNYLYQDGILKADNNFNRYNIRAQTEAKAFEWLKVGYNVIISNSTLLSAENASFTYAYFASPLYPVYDNNNTLANPVKYGTSTSIGFGNGVYGNPVAKADYYYDRTKSFQVLPSIYADFGILKNKLTFRSQLSQKYASNQNINYIPEYYVDAYQKATDGVSKLTSKQDRNTNYVWDNLLTYKDGRRQHHWTVLLGQSIRQDRWRQIWVSATDVPNEEAYWYTGLGESSKTGYGEDGILNKGQSYFTRLSYDFANKYLLTATFRADGSSKYQEKWGYFPSIGVGWVISKEGFMQNQNLFNFLKLRGSWGKLGNDGIPPNAAYAKAVLNQAIFGTSSISNGAYVPGYYVDAVFSNIAWEVVDETDIGLDFTILDQGLNGTIDYYHRLTNNMAFSKSIPFTNKQLYGNWGKVLNEGIEASLNWADKISPDLGYRIGANITTLKNTVKDLGGLAYMMTGVPEFPTRVEVGLPINYFYGYEVLGVYQNRAEIDGDPAIKNMSSGDKAAIQPGYFKYKDVNGDGIFNADDRVNIGSYLPKLTYGFNLGLDFKGFDFSIMFYGQQGNKILNMNRARRNWYSDMNGDENFVSNLWTGEGSTNAYPSAFASTQGRNNLASSFFVENGSYLRIQNAQLGYNFNFGKNNSPKIRLYITADRPWIHSRYNGFTPEISGTGYDENVYPISATYSFGCRVTF